MGGPPASLGLRAWCQRAFPTGRRLAVGEPAIEALRAGDVELECVPADERVAAGAAGTVVYWAVAAFEPELQCLLAIGARLYRGPMAIDGRQAMCQLRDPWGKCLGLRGKGASVTARSQLDGGPGPGAVRQAPGPRSDSPAAGRRVQAGTDGSPDSAIASSVSS